MNDIDRALAEAAAWRDNVLWGSKAIANVACRSVDTVMRWAEQEDCPITKSGGRYFVVRSELIEWLKRKSAA